MDCAAQLLRGAAIARPFHSEMEADHSWPSDLARRLDQRGRAAAIAVVNEGIAGNRLLADGFGIKALGTSALARFDRDVLAVPGVTHVVLLEGVNDLGFPGATLGGHPLADAMENRTVEDLIGAYRQLIDRAHARGLKAIGATLTPFEEVVGSGFRRGTLPATGSIPTTSATRQWPMRSRCRSFIESTGWTGHERAGVRRDTGRA